MSTLRQLGYMVVMLGCWSRLDAADPLVGTWKFNPAKSLGTVPKEEVVVAREDAGTLFIEISIVDSGYSLARLIVWAYDVHRTQVMGGSAWIDSDRYNVVGRPDSEGQPSLMQWKTMLRKLLADRFYLTFHPETKELSAYTITVAKGEPKVSVTEGDATGIPAITFYAPGKVSAHNATLADFARSMQRSALDRPMIDRMGLTGRYDFGLSWVPDEVQFGNARTPASPQIADHNDGVDLFAALRQQLGLKLEATKAPVEVIAIDHVEKPSEN